MINLQVVSIRSKPGPVNLRRNINLQVVSIRSKPGPVKEKQIVTVVHGVILSSGEQSSLLEFNGIIEGVTSRDGVTMTTGLPLSKVILSDSGDPTTKSIKYKDTLYIATMK